MTTFYALRHGGAGAPATGEGADELAGRLDVQAALMLNYKQRTMG